MKTENCGHQGPSGLCPNCATGLIHENELLTREVESLRIQLGAFDPKPVIPFVPLPNPVCYHCGGSALRNSSMNPGTWTCNTCGRHTLQEGISENR